MQLSPSQTLTNCTECHKKIPLSSELPVATQRVHPPSPYTSSTNARGPAAARRGTGSTASTKPRCSWGPEGLFRAVSPCPSCSWCPPAGQPTELLYSQTEAQCVVRVGTRGPCPARKGPLFPRAAAGARSSERGSVRPAPSCGAHLSTSVCQPRSRLTGHGLSFRQPPRWAQPSPWVSRVGFFLSSGSGVGQSFGLRDLCRATAAPERCATSFRLSGKARKV